MTSACSRCEICSWQVALSTVYEFLQKLGCLCESTERVIGTFNKTLDKLTDETGQIMQAKMKMWKEILWNMKVELAYYLREVVNEIAHRFIYSKENLLVLTLR